MSTASSNAPPSSEVFWQIPHAGGGGGDRHAWNWQSYKQPLKSSCNKKKKIRL